MTTVVCLSVIFVCACVCCRKKRGFWTRLVFTEFFAVALVFLLDEWEFTDFASGSSFREWGLLMLGAALIAFVQWKFPDWFRWYEDGWWPNG